MVCVCVCVCVCVRARDGVRRENAGARHVSEEGMAGGNPLALARGVDRDLCKPTDVGVYKGTGRFEGTDA